MHIATLGMYPLSSVLHYCAPQLDRLTPKHTKPRNALMPVNRISGPYPVPYPNTHSPLKGSPFNRTPASGPEIIQPTPRLALNRPSIPSFASQFSLRTSLIIALQTVLKPPANVPYAIAKKARTGRFVANPQSRNMDSVEPAVEMAITAVTGR